MNHINVKLSPSVWAGLFGLAIFTVLAGVAAFDFSMMAFHPKPASSRYCECPKLDLPTYSQNRSLDQFRSSTEAPPVNSAALNEVKQGPPCVNCPPVYRYPIVRTPVVTPSVPVVYPSTPVVTPVVNTPQPLPQPTPSPVQPQPVPSTASKTIIALFLDGSQKASVIRQWFDADPNLVKLKAKCAFEVYTPDNALYKTRYASVIPANQFPAVLFLYPDGGHIHAAGGNMIPRTSTELYADMKTAYEKAQSVRTAQIAPGGDSGLVKTRGYSWDQQINPSMQLQSTEDCPGGACPEDRWRPGDRVRDLFDRADDAKNVVMWASATEIFTIAMLVLIGILALAILLKRTSR